MAYLVRPRPPLSQVSGMLKGGVNPSPGAPPVVVVGQRAEAPLVVINQLPFSSPVAVNVFMGTLLNTLGFSVEHVWVLVQYVYNAVDTVL